MFNWIQKRKIKKIKKVDLKKVKQAIDDVYFKSQNHYGVNNESLKIVSDFYKIHETNINMGEPYFFDLSNGRVYPNNDFEKLIDDIPELVKMFHGDTL